MDSGGETSKHGGDIKSSDRRRRHFFHQFLRIMLLFAAVALSCMVLYHTAYPFQLFPTSFNPSTYTSSPNSTCGNLSSPNFAKNENELERVLKKASMADKTVIITLLNDAWAEPNSIFDLFLESFKMGNQTERLLSHLVVVALDDKAYGRCMTLHPHCYDLSSDGFDFSSEAKYMSSEYLKMMWMRTDFLRTVLDLGYNFIFTDADIMWFRDPFPHFYPDSDFQIACDSFQGNPSDLNNLPNNGFTYVKSNNRTINFYKLWYTSRETYPGLNEQDVLNKIKHDPYISQIGLQIKFLDTKYFGGFCEPSRDFNQVCTMHANCCIGLDSKIHDLKIMLINWGDYISKRVPQPSYWTVPQRCKYVFNHL